MAASNDKNVNEFLEAACSSFRGAIGPDSAMGVILAILLLKYLSDTRANTLNLHNEFINQSDDYIFELPEEINFYTLYEQRDEQGNNQRIQRALRALELNRYYGISRASRSLFEEVYFSLNNLGENNQTNWILHRLLITIFQKSPNLSQLPMGTPDIIGDIYNKLMRNAANNNKKFSAFYTPPEVSNLLAELLTPKLGDSICDPACGTGSTLSIFARKIKSIYQSNNYTLYGQEAIASVWALANLNMILNGEPHHRIEIGDTIRDPKLTDDSGNLLQFDIVASHPPFSLDQWSYNESQYDKFDRFHRGEPPRTKSDYAFIQHMIETLKPNVGRMAIITPLGVLFRGSSEAKIRKKLITEGLLEAVIGLPEKLFYDTGISTALLVFSKRSEHEGVIFIDASNEYQAGKSQNSLTGENIQKISGTYRKKQTVEKYSYIASLDEICENNYNLNIPLYVNTHVSEKHADIETLLFERNQLKTQLSNNEKDIDKYLRQLGYSPHNKIT